MHGCSCEIAESLVHGYMVAKLQPVMLLLLLVVVLAGDAAVGGVVG
jgi:hypothetical protein